MAEGYVPAAFADEWTPPPRATPDLWIIDHGEGCFALDPSDFDDDDDFARNQTVKNGEAVAFRRLEPYPDSILTMNADRTWTCVPPMPDGAEQVWVAGDFDTLAATVEELVKEAGVWIDPGEHVLEFFTWRDEVWTFDATTKTFTRGAA